MSGFWTKKNGDDRRTCCTYDAAGNRVRKGEETGKDHRIRTGRIQENRYDAEGLRHEMRENEKLLRFVYQNGELLYEEGGDKETASYHLGAGIEAVRRGQRTYYYHPDEQLSTALITDETGTIKNQYRYDAFGAGLETSEKLPNRICYTGQQYDGVTEQYYLRARYYNPILGRFLQEDVCQGDGLNLYAYCRNNPVVYWDPSGYTNTQTPLGKSCSTAKVSDGSSDERSESTRELNQDELGELVGKGGNKEVYAVGDGQVVAILQDGKPSSGIDKEITMLKQLEELGLPVVNAEKVIVDGKPGILMDKYAQDSKSIVAYDGKKGKVMLKPEADTSLLNQNSIDDLTNIMQTMKDGKVSINDLQFLIAEDGHMVVADPLNIIPGQKPSNNNIKMLNILIEEAKKMDRREKVMENFDVYEYDILSKREDLLRSVVNQKVNRMIRYGLEPKENFSQEYENEDKMAFSLSEGTLVIEFENGTFLAFNSEETKWSVYTWAERYKGRDRIVRHGECELLKDAKDIFPIMADDKKYSTEFFANIINQTLVRYEIIKQEPWAEVYYYLPREVGLILTFSNESQMILSHKLTTQVEGTFFAVLEWSQIDKEIFQTLYKPSRFW